MCNQGIRHAAATLCGNNPLEILSGRIAAAKQRGFALMELRIIKGDIAANDRNQNIGATMTNKGKTPLHGFRIARSIENSIKEIATCNL
ncbi:hypothetical protein D3C80_1586460 [compost metagenome]